MYHITIWNLSLRVFLARSVPIQNISAKNLADILLWCSVEVYKSDKLASLQVRYHISQPKQHSWVPCPMADFSTLIEMDKSSEVISYHIGDIGIIMS